MEHTNIIGTVQLLAFPRYLVEATNPLPEWDLVRIPGPTDFDIKYELRHNGQFVINIPAYYGFGWGCVAHYEELSIEAYDQLKSIPGYSGRVSVWKWNTSPSLV